MAQNKALEENMADLRSKSFELEKKLRRIVALSTNTEEDMVDDMVEKLAMAIESEDGEEVDIGRVREFLRKVEKDEM